VLNATFVLWGVIVVGMLSQQPAVPSASLDYDFFKSKVEPIFLNKRPDRARCISCHTVDMQRPLQLEPLSPGSKTWTEEQSRKNFDLVRRMVVPGSMKSPLLVHALAEEAGGDFFHSGGKQFASQADPEWQTLRTWVMGGK